MPSWLWPAGPLSLLCIFAVATPFVYSQTLSQGFEVTKGLTAQLSILLAALWSVLRPRVAAPAPAGAKVFWLAVAGFLLWSWASLGWSPDRFGAANRATHWTLCAVAVAVVAQAGPGRANGLTLLRALGAGATLLSVFGLVYWWLGWDFVPSAAAPSATMGNRNWAAEILVIAGPAAVALVLLETCSCGRWLAGLGLGFIAAFLYHTSSAACWVAFALQLLAVALLVAWPPLRRRLNLDRARLQVLAAAVLLALALLPVTPDGLTAPLTGLRNELEGKWKGVQALREQPLEEIRHEAAGARNVTLRAEYIRRVWWMAQERPWRGAGLSGFESAYRYSGLERGEPPLVDLVSRLANPHNDLLQILAELGWIGVGLALATVLLFLRMAADALRAALAAPDTLPIVLAALLGLLGFAICGLFAYPLFTNTTTFHAALLAGLVISLAPKTAPGRMAATSRLRASLLLPLLLVASAVWAFWSGRALVLASQVGQIVVASQAGDNERVVELFRRLSGRDLGRRDYLPYGADARLKLGDAQGADDLCEEYLKHYPADANGLMLAAQAAQLNGDPARALTRINLALRLIPDLPEPWRIRAGLHLQAGNIDATIADLEAAVRLDPADALHLAMLGTLLVNRGVRPDEAVELIERAMALDPQLRTDAALAAFLARAREQKPAP